LAFTGLQRGKPSGRISDLKFEISKRRKNKTKAGDLAIVWPVKSAPIRLARKCWRWRRHALGSWRIHPPKPQKRLERYIL
jgi:hypothetical protein